MGAFFTNVMVRVGDRSVEPLLEALREAAAAEGLDELEDGDGADRGVVVTPADAGGWVAIYDQATEGQDVDALEAVAALASRALGAPAVTALVHDSDVLDLRLFEAGERVDRYDSFPGYFGGKVTKKQRADASGHPERWRGVLIAGATTEALRKAWTAEDHFAERTLRKTCALIGCDPSRASVGYRYALEMGLPEGSVELQFRARERPAYEQPLEGPPKLEAQSYAGKVRTAVGDQLHVGVTARNVGGASQGLRVVAWGNAIDEGLVSIERFELLVGDVMAGVEHVMLTPERGEVTSATIDDQPIPAGVAETGYVPGMDPLAMLAAFRSANVHVNVVGAIVAPGEGTLNVALVPLTNRDGAHVVEQQLSIDAALPRPRRAAPHVVDSGHASHVLRPLTSTRHAVLLVSFAVPRNEAAEAARRLIERTQAVLGKGGRAERTIYRSGDARPKTGGGAAKRALTGKALDKLVSSMIEELTVDVTVSAKKGGSPAWGVSFGTTVIPMAEDERAPAMVLFADHETVAELDALTADWATCIDALATGGAIEQATFDRTGWTAFGGAVSETPYEQVCGIESYVTTLPEWTKRWLRMPGKRLWFGQALREHLDEAALAPLGAITTLGKALRFDAARGVARSALEQALLGVLPGEADAKPIVDRLFERDR